MDQRFPPEFRDSQQNHDGGDNVQSESAGDCSRDQLTSIPQKPSDAVTQSPSTDDQSEDRSSPIPQDSIRHDSGTNFDHAAPLEQKAESNIPGNEPKKEARGGFFLKFWLLETAASILSVASLLSLVIVLRNYDGQSLNEINLPNSLTLNGIVAAIATFNRITLMVPVGSALSQEAWLWFSSSNKKSPCPSRLGDLNSSDAASRGAWGSLVFLFVARRRWIAYLGALTTILSLAFGVCTQQLLSLEEFPVTSRNGNLQPINIPRIESWDYRSGNPAEGSTTIPLSLKAAFYNGMLSGDVSPITASCPTGNCTWPITPSLAICGECSPTTYKLKCNETFCNYTMASGTIISLSNTSNSDGEGIGFRVQSGTGSKYNATLLDRLYIANFDVVGAPDGPSYPGQHLDTALATECAMWFCVQAYSVQVQNGNQVQTVVETFSSNSSAFSVNDTTFYNFPTIPAAMNAIPHTNYSVLWLGFQGFQETTRSWFQGYGFIDISTSEASNDFVDAIWHSSRDLNPWIKRVALGVTNALRNYTDPALPTPIYPAYFGTSYQLGITVRWEWIALPAIVVLLSVIFLAVIIVQTQRGEMIAWKSNPLAQLFFDVDQELKEQATGHIDTLGGVEDAVGYIKVRFGQEPGGTWAFKTA